MDSFDRSVLAKLENLFDADEVQTLALRPDPEQTRQDTRPRQEEFAVKVIHNATGMEVVCNDFQSQIQNKSMALIGLIELLKKQS